MIGNTHTAIKIAILRNLALRLRPPSVINADGRVRATGISTIHLTRLPTVKELVFASLNALNSNLLTTILTILFLSVVGPLAKPPFWCFDGLDIRFQTCYYSTMNIYGYLLRYHNITK